MQRARYARQGSDGGGVARQRVDGEAIEARLQEVSPPQRVAQQQSR